MLESWTRFQMKRIVNITVAETMTLTAMSIAQLRARIIQVTCLPVPRTFDYGDVVILPRIATKLKLLDLGLDVRLCVLAGVCYHRSRGAGEGFASFAWEAASEERDE